MMSHFLKPIGALVSRLFIGLMLLVGLVLAACGGNEKTNEVPLAMLTKSSASYDDSQVVTSGVVRRFEDPLHYWIEDADLNRVEIFPQEKVAPYLGEEVLVEGHFRFSATEGRRLTLTDIERE